MPEPSHPAGDGSIRRLRVLFWCGSVPVAALQAYLYRHTMNPDGLSYLDIASAYLAGDLTSAINAYWGPLYSWILAAALWLTDASPRTESTVVHAANLAIFIGALAAFDFFLRELLRRRRDDLAPAATATLDDHSVTLFGYGVFLYTTLYLNGLALVSPDLCLAALLFAAAGLALRLQSPRASVITAAAFGAALALGYFAKSVMFPLAFIFLGGQLLSGRSPAQLRRVGVAAGVFVAASALLIAPISAATGGLTFGTSGPLTYGFEVLGRPFGNWQGDSTAGSARPLHPPRRLPVDAPMYEYTAHLRGTYPPWFDPSWWNAGAKVDFRLRHQLDALAQTLDFGVALFFGSAGAAATILCVLAWSSAHPRPVRRALAGMAPALLPALAAILIYVPVNFRPRYVAASVTIVWVALAAGAAEARIQTASWTRRVMGQAAAVCTIVLLTSVALSIQAATREGVPADDQLAVAEALRASGIRPGDRVAHIGIDGERDPARAAMAYWARLAGVQLVASMPDGASFLCADSAAAAVVFDELKKLDARAVVTHAIPLPACRGGWQQVEGTAYYFRQIADQADTLTRRILR
jgi:hypothetical protein